MAAPVWKWHKEWSVGNPMLDAQHRLFIEKINQFETAQQSQWQSFSLRELMEYLRQFASEHFCEEEYYMASHNYPELDKHQEIHQGFVSQLDVFAERMRNEEHEEFVVPKIENFLAEWLVDHIQSVDQKYAVFIGKELQWPVILAEKRRWIF